MSDDLGDRMRRLAGRLDESAVPVSASEARERVARGRGARRWLAPGVAAAVVVVVVAAGALVVSGDDDASTSVVLGPSDATVTSTTASSTSTSTAVPTTTTPPPAGGLAGERIDLYPYEGAALAVVGVAADDVLNVRTAPGPAAPVAFTLRPLATDVRATGHNRIVSGAMWSEVTADGRTGWANARFLLQPGATDDVTARWYPRPADRPSAPSMDALAELVADHEASDEPPSRVVVVDGPSEGDLAEVVVDVIGLGDDSVGGVRLHVFAERTGRGFTVRTVEATVLCSRGVTDGVCV